MRLGNKETDNDRQQWFQMKDSYIKMYGRQLRQKRRNKTEDVDDDDHINQILAIFSATQELPLCEFFKYNRGWCKQRKCLEPRLSGINC